MARRGWPHTLGVGGTAVWREPPAAFYSSDNAVGHAAGSTLGEYEKSYGLDWAIVTRSGVNWANGIVPRGGRFAKLDISSGLIIKSGCEMLSNVLG